MKIVEGWLYMKKEKKVKAEKHKEKKMMPKAEFLFNVMSLLIIIGLGIYFGSRSIYYYSKHTNASKKEVGTLVEHILEENDPTQDKDGFHQIDDGYLFVGNVENNYVLFSNRLFRILKINKDHTIKLVSENNQTILTLGDVTTYEGSNLEIWLTKKDQIDSSGIFYQSLSDAYNHLVETTYCEGTFKNNKVTCSGKKKKDYVTLLSVEDYLNASSKDGFLNNGTYTWLLGNQDGSFLYMSEDGKIGKASYDEGYGVRAVITLDSHSKYVTGDGTKENPYQIEESNPTKVGKYVQLGNDLYQIYRQDDRLYYFSLSNYFSLNGQEVQVSYDSSTTLFDPRTRGNIAYYLNNTYFYQLPYRDLLQDFFVYTGEISQEMGFSYLNQYQNNTTVKMGLLSIADLKCNADLTDYALSNTTSSVGDIGYLYNRLGILTEENVSAKKHVVPTIAILKTILTQGDGTKENPLKVG